VYIIVLFIALFLTILSPLQAQATTYNWSSLSGIDDSGGSGFKTVGTAGLVVSNIFKDAGNDEIYPNNSNEGESQKVVIKAGSSVCQFNVGELRLYSYNNNTTFKQFDINFKNSSGTTITSLSLASNPYILVANTPKTLADIFGSFSGASGISEIEMILNPDNGGGAASNITFKNVDLDNISATCAPSPEPTNHPTSFTATANTSSKITTSWTDSTGTQLPAGYLVMCNTSDSFTDPVDKTAQTDDTDCSDGGVQNIAQGNGSAEWTGLNSGTQYYFKVYPYTNSGSDIDYKTDGTPSTANATTLKNVVYVSSTGNDNTGDGSSGTPYLTLTKGIQQVADGGTVNVAAGTYIETTMITLDKDVTITGDSTTNTIVDGNNHHPLFKIDFGKTVEMNYLTIRNGLADGTNVPQTDGGGINNAGTLTFNNCTVSGNTAQSGGGAINNSGPLTLNNSTISGNTATNHFGGGIRNYDTLTLNNSTVSNNAAPNGEGGGINNLGTTLTLKNTLIVGNTSNDNKDVTGTIDTNTTSCLGSDCTSNDGKTIASISWLDNLGSNGGPTQTHALLTGAPATVVSAGSGCLTNDQRGITRATACDVGAYEASKISIAVGTTPTEAGTVGTFTITLTPKLLATESLTINYSTTAGTATISDDYDISSTEPSITFNTNSFTITDIVFDVSKVTLDIPAQDDSIDDDAETVKLTLTSANNGYIIAPGSDNATLTITDNDTAGFSLSKTTASVNESGTTDTFTLVLDSKPASNVVMTVSSSDTGEVTVSPTTLTFTSSNWDTAQTLTLTGVEETLIDGDQTSSITLSVDDANSDDQYDPLADKTVSVTTGDNDSPGIIPTPSSLTISEPNGTGSFTIKLNTIPSGSANVTINSISASNAECSVSPTSTTIANANWNTGTTFTVTAQNDDGIDGNQTCTIQIGTSTSSDADYNNIVPTDVTVTVQDDDTAGIDGASLGGSISITEGATGSYDIKLSSQPTGDVEMTVTADTQTEINKDGSTSFSNTVTLTFTNGNWNTAQTITVRAIDDSNIEGSHSSTITHAISGTVNDTNYPTSLTLGDVTVNITDNDSPPPPATPAPTSPPPSSSGSSSSSVPASKTVTIVFEGDGQGRVSSNPTGLDCEAIKGQCQHDFEFNRSVKLIPTAATASQFKGWKGADDCLEGDVLMSRDLSCTAIFESIPQTLTVLKVNNGTVHSTPEGIICDKTGKHCQHSFKGGETVKLTATPDDGWQFTRWGIDCNEEGIVEMDRKKKCQAHFSKKPVVTPQPETPPVVTPQPETPAVVTPLPETTPPVVTPETKPTSPGTTSEDTTGLPKGRVLTVTQVGNGTISSLPEGLQCDSQHSIQCTHTFEAGKTVTLTATPDNGWQFQGWEGDCFGPILMTTDQSCKAIFAPITPSPEDDLGTPSTLTPAVTPIWEYGTPNTLSVSIVGMGTVTSQPKGIQCGNECVALFAPNTDIILTATPAEGYRFSQWESDCLRLDAKNRDAKHRVATKINQALTCQAIFETYDPILGKTTVVSEPQPFVQGVRICPTVGRVDWKCNAQWQILRDLIIDTKGDLSNGNLDGTITNRGRVSNLNIDSGSVMTGGIVTGFITNKGLMADFECRGGTITGGTLSGRIQHTGLVRCLIQDVDLAAETQMTGLNLSGQIQGNPDAPALLNKVKIAGKSQVKDVILGEEITVRSGNVIFENVLLVPNVQFNGGGAKVQGYLIGLDAVAPAHVANIRLAPCTVIDNVILGKQVSYLEEKTPERQGLRINTRGKIADSQACFTGQIRSSGKLQHNDVRLSQKQAQNVHLTMTLTVDPKHVGLAADILIVAFYDKADSQETQFLLRDAQEWVTWDGADISGLPAAAHYQGAKQKEILIYEGDLSHLPGEFKVLVGYRLKEGSVIFNGKRPLHFFVE